MKVKLHCYETWKQYFNFQLISERKRKASTGDSEGENIKKEKRRKSSERKKVRRASEQTRGKDAKGDSENVNQHSGKHMELEKLAKSCLDQSVSSDEINGTVTNECIEKAEVRTGRECNDKIISLSHNLGSTKAVDTQINSDSELSHTVRKDSSKLHGDQGNIKSTQKSDETHSGISGYGKIILGGKNSASGKILCSSVEESCNVRGSLLLNPIKKGTDSGSETDVTRHDDVRSREETAAAAILLQPLSKPKIILMQSDDDDDEDFINIKADAEAGKLSTHNQFIVRIFCWTLSVSVIQFIYVAFWKLALVPTSGKSNIVIYIHRLNVGDSHHITFYDIAHPNVEVLYSVTHFIQTTVKPW